jgi:hypothetical protein
MRRLKSPASRSPLPSLRSAGLRVFAALLVALAFPAYALAAANVTASVTPGVTVQSTTTLATGSIVSFTSKLPNGYTPIAFANGTGAGQVSVAWSDTRTYAASTPVTLDLTALASAATNTGAANFAKVKVLYIANNEAIGSGHNVIVGAAASTAFTGPLGGTTPTFTIEPGCVFMAFAQSSTAWTTTSANNLKIDPGANNCSVTIVVAGN